MADTDSTAAELDEELTRIVAERQITRVLHRYCHACDRGDEELMRSVYHPDGIDEHGTNFIGLGWDFAAFSARSARERLRWEAMMHHLTSVAIDVDGDVAAAQSYVLAIHEPIDGGPIACVGGRYLDRFERRDGEWRIAYRRFVHDLEFEVPRGRVSADGIGTYVQGERSPADPSYALFASLHGGRPWPASADPA